MMMTSFRQYEGLRYFSFDIFEKEAVNHGVFTRHGGVSPAPWFSLNTGGMSGDNRENVIENRRRIFSAFNRPVETIYDVWQVHSADVVCADRPRPLDQPHEKADAIITNCPDVTLFMRFGDCVPILFFDPVQKVVALTHAGWQGTVKRIVQATVEKMVERYHCKPADILAGIGPSIGVDRYEVGEDVVSRVEDSFGSGKEECIRFIQGRAHFDLWKANQWLLLESGLKADHIQIAGICTATNAQDWYSHRAEFGKTGRFGALITLI
jgi:YfiH family protein